MTFYGGVDAGGTKFLCAIGRSPTEIERTVSIPTTSPAETLGAVADFFGDWLQEGRPLSGIGVSSFGPIDRDPASPDHGRLGNTPKPGWANVDMAGHLGRLAVPIRVDTDVNGAALAEGRWGAAKNHRHFAYVTVGTGIGVGVVSEGRLVNGSGHPELGHYRPPRHPADGFAGACPFHRDCLEGLVAGPGIAGRTGRRAADLADGDPVWDVIAHYLAHLCGVLVLAFAPERIVLGGGLMRRAALLPAIRREAAEQLGGYVSTLSDQSAFDRLIAPSALDDDAPSGVNAGVLGGFLLAQASIPPEAEP